ncbi:hypothetical protein COCOBI_08-4960 [Coccomyxa sp. Obi]|nr:hypothetical protein COCOBI_08-4960 [Coccomyxa sp. Obi]
MCSSNTGSNGEMREKMEKLDPRLVDSVFCSVIPDGRNSMQWYNFTGQHQASAWCRSCLSAPSPLRPFARLLGCLLKGSSMERKAQERKLIDMAHRCKYQRDLFIHINVLSIIQPISMTERRWCMHCSHCRNASPVSSSSMKIASVLSARKYEGVLMHLCS